MMDFCLLSVLFIYFFKEEEQSQMGLKGRTLSVGNRKHKIRAFSPFCGHEFAALPCWCINKLVQPEASCSP